MEKPDVDRIDGISPAIAIRQKNSVRNPRSTVGTTTEIHDYMRLLYARIGRTYCRNCGKEVVRETAEVVSGRLGGLASGTRLLLGFDVPIVDAAVATTIDGSEEDELREAPDGDSLTAADDLPFVGVEPTTKSRDREDQKQVAVSASSTSAVKSTLDALRRKGFRRLLIEGRPAAFDDIDPATLSNGSMVQVVV